MENQVAKLLSIDRSVLHRDILRFYLVSASLPAVAQIVDLGLGDSFTFQTRAWFPFVVMLNIFFPSEADLPEMGLIRSMALQFFSCLCLLLFSFKLSDMSMITFKDDFYFWSTVVANSHAIAALFFIGLRRPQSVERQEEGVADAAAAYFKYQVTCVLLISPFLASEGAEQSTNSILFRLCGMAIIVLIGVLPWMRIGWEFRIRVLNLTSAYFLIFLLLVFELKEFPVYSLMSCLKFILFCSFIIFYDGTTQMKRDMSNTDIERSLISTSDDDQFQGSGTHPEEIVEEEFKPSVFPYKISQLPDPVLVSPEPTSLQIISLEQNRIRTSGIYSSGVISEVHKVAIDEDEQQEAVYKTDLVPVNMASDIEVYLQDCISYCSLFPADYEFTRDILVWSWLAAKIINSDNNNEMEEVAFKCFDRLVTLECIVQYGYESLSDQMSYKVGNGENVFFGKQYSKRLDDGTNVEELAHLSLISKEINEDHFEILKKCNNLKTLLLHKCNMSKLDKSLNDLFLKLKLLTTLDLSCTDIAELPSSVENLRSLKCLDLSRTPITWLPISIESLSNLETLILIGCRSLRGLPRGMSKLTNLQHLSLDTRLQLNAMPVGMGKLTKLLSLKAFPVGRKDGNRIGELRFMNKLKGSLSICKLENILNEEEADMAVLCDKQLTELEFLWSDLDRQDAMVTIEEEILENLRPNFGLQKLKIGFYSGGILPSWISNPSFNQMVNITLSWCRYCEMLPSLGELPSLKFLSIIEMDGVVHIDNFFCRKLGNEDMPAFPQLEKLSIEGMSSLVTWTGVGDCDFARLLHLAIKYCPKLVSLPCLAHLNSLQHMEISYCDELACLPGVGDSVKSLVVKECPKLGA